MSGPYTREEIMNGMIALLVSRLGPAPGSGVIASFSRRLMMYEDMVSQINNGTAPAFPALYMFDGVGFGGGKDLWVPGGRGSPSKRTLDRTIVIYARIPGGGLPSGPDGTTPGGSVLQPLIDAVESALESDTPVIGTVTLGGKVYHAWIEGEGFLISGDIDATGLCMQTIPVRILIP